MASSLLSVGSIVFLFVFRFHAFAKVLLPAVAFLRAQGIRLQAYVNDLLLAAQKSCFIDHFDLLLEKP